MKVHFVVHESYESPAAFQQWVLDRGHDASYSAVFENDELLDNTKDVDFLIVMGGPQSPASTMDDFPHFNAQKEISLIRDAVERKKLVLGICLGAQLLGEAFGAKYEHSPNQEIGVFPISLTDAGKKDKLLQHFPDKLMVGHWHSDMPGIFSDANLLAESEGCPRQIVAFNERSYGFQCHMEFTQSSVAHLVDVGKKAFEREPLPTYVQPAKFILNYDYDLMNQVLFRFLDAFSERV